MSLSSCLLNHMCPGFPCERCIFIKVKTLFVKCGQQMQCVYFDSFLPSTIREWNNLPADVKSAQTLTSFKYKFERNTPKIPKYYFFGDRGNQILHTRLRTECSTLKFHLYRRNLIPEPYCTCGAVENTSHFLLKCPKCNAFRRELLLTVSNYVEPSEAVLLFGDDTLSDEGNEVIFRAFHK